MLTTFDFDQIFTEDLHYYEEEDAHPRQIGRYGPSELSFPCRRSTAFKYLYPKRHVTDPESLWNFELGKYVEEWFLRRIQKSLQWKFLEKQGSVSQVLHDGILVHGLRDIKALHLPSKTVFNIEVKLDKANFRYVPKDNHILQQNFYLKDGLPGLLVYVTPWLHTKTFPYRFDPELLQRMAMAAYEIHYPLIEDRLPSADPTGFNGKVCNYCLFTEECVGRK